MPSDLLILTPWAPSLAASSIHLTWSAIPASRPRSSLTAAAKSGFTNSDEAIRILRGVRSRLLELLGKPAEMNDALDSRCVHRGNQSFHRQLRSLRFQVPVHIGGRVARTLDLFTLHLQDGLRLVLVEANVSAEQNHQRVVEALRAQESLVRIPLDQLTDPQGRDCQQADGDKPEQQALASPQEPRGAGSAGGCHMLVLEADLPVKRG